MYSGFAPFSAIIVVIFISSILYCASAPRYTRNKRAVRPSSKLNTKSNKVSGKTVSGHHSLQGVASYYGPGFHGKKTASGEQFNMYGLTAAHKTLPFNTKVLVKNLDNGKSVIVRINDRGPYKKGRIIDLSTAAAKEIGLTGTGTAKVKLKILP